MNSITLSIISIGDARNIYEICDYNVPYEIDLADAINKGMLAPFHYYGIYDATDYSGLRIVRGHYQETDLEKLYLTNQARFDLIWKYYEKYPSRRALGFCSSRKHAEEMARQFNLRGCPAAAVYSNAQGEFSEERDIALSGLREGTYRVIFSVDMFNEGEVIICVRTISKCFRIRCVFLNRAIIQ